MTPIEETVRRIPAIVEHTSGDTKRPVYSIVIPFYNEETAAPLLLQEILSVLPQLDGPVECLCTNDGSSDETESVLNAFATRAGSCLRIITFPRNRGQAAALWAGLHESRGKIVITLDGDGQNDPADIPRLLHALTGVDMVVGIRQNRKDNCARRWMSRLANTVRDRILRDGMRDSGCALKAFRREVITSLVPIRTLYSFIPAMATAADFRLRQIPVQHRERIGGRSNYSVLVFPLATTDGFAGYVVVYPTHISAEQVAPNDTGGSANMILRLRDNEFILVILLAIVVLGGWLGSRGLNEPDESRFAEISREMALQKDWLVPHLNGVPHLQKPPLTYWITAVFIRLFGANEWAVRLTPALAAFGTLLFTMYIAGVLYGKGCQWKAGLILMTSTGFFITARLITTDMLLTFCITASVAGLVGYVKSKYKAWLCVFYMAMGFGSLSKGPLGILVPALAAMAVQMGQRCQRKPVIRLFWFAGLPVALLIGLSWYLALIHRDRTLFDYFFRYEFVDRIATDTHNRSKSIWFYPSTLALGLIPWTGFVVVLLRDLWRRRGNLAVAYLWLFIGWVIVPYAILSLVVSKLATYLLPLMPPVAIVIARWFEHPTTGEHWRRPARLTVYILGMIVPILPILVFIRSCSFSPLQNLFVGFLIAIILATASFMFLGHALGKGLSLRSFLFWAVATWACVMLAMVTQADSFILRVQGTVRTLTEYIKRVDPSGTAPVFVYGTRANGTEFYLRRFVYRSFSKSDVVLPLEDELRHRIVQDDTLTASSLRDISAFILVKQSSYLKTPELREWHVIFQHDKWMLLASRHVVTPALSRLPRCVTERTSEVVTQPMCLAD